MSRFSRDDWIQLALVVLAEEGPSGLTVARLCQRAGRTRGSLYHHFDDHDGLLWSVLRRWRHDYTDALIEAVPAGSAAVITMSQIALALDFGVEQAIRRLVAKRDDLRAFVAEADGARVSHLAALLENRGLDTGSARMRAEIEYAAFLGFQQLDVPPERLAELFAWFDGLA